METSVYSYYLFISYSRIDSKAAAYMQYKLEHFRIPSRLLSKEMLPGKGPYLRPVFRDKRDLKNTEYSFTEDIRQALAKSRYLMVICSPNSADSIWVNEEIAYFLSTHEQDYTKIVPVILAGSPGVGGTLECLPPNLNNDKIISRNLPTMIPDDGETEKAGWENGLIQALSYMLKVDREKIKATVDKAKLRQMRHYLAVGLCAAVVFAVLMVWALRAQHIANENRRLAENNEQRAVEAEKQANKDAEVSKNTLQFMREMFAASPEGEENDRRVKDVLITQMTKIETLKPEELKVSVSEVVGDLLLDNSVYVPALDLLRYAYKTYSELGNQAKSQQMARKLGICLEYLGNYEEAERMYEKAKSNENPQILLLLAGIAEKQYEFEKAERYALQADRAIQNNLHAYERLTIEAYLCLASIYHGMQQREKEFEYLANAEKELSHDEQKYGVLTKVDVYEQFAMYYQSQLMLDKSLEYGLKALKFLQSVSREFDMRTAMLLCNIGLSYNERKDRKTAIEYYLRALEICRKILPDGSRLEGTLYNNLGAAYEYMGNAAEGKKYFELGVVFHKKYFGKMSTDTATAIMNLGFYYYNRRNYIQALALFEEAQEIHQQNGTLNSTGYAMILNNMGTTYAALNDHKKALQYLKHSLALFEDFYEKNVENSMKCSIHHKLAVSYWALKDKANAEKHSQLAVDFAKHNLPEQDSARRMYESLFMQIQEGPITGKPSAGQATQTTETTEGEEKEKERTQPLSQTGREYHSYRMKTGQCEQAMRQGQYDKALELQQELLEKAIQLFGRDNKEILPCYRRQHLCYMELGRKKEALKAAENLLRLTLLLYGESSEMAVEAYGMLGEAHFANKEDELAADYMEKSSLLALNNEQIHESVKIARLTRLRRQLWKMKVCERFFRHLEEYLKSLKSDSSLYYRSALMREELRMLTVMKDLEGAEKKYRQILDLFDKQDDWNKNGIYVTHFTFGDSLSNAGMYQESLVYFHKALEVIQSMEHPSWPDWFMQYRQLAYNSKELGNYKDARDYSIEALRIIREHNLNKKEIAFCEEIRQNCQDLLDGKRIAFEVIKVLPCGSAGKVGVQVGDVVLALGTWSILDVPERPHAVIENLISEIEGGVGHSRKLMVARTINGKKEVIAYDCPPGPMRMSLQFNYLPYNEFIQYQKLLDN